MVLYLVNNGTIIYEFKVSLDACIGVVLRLYVLINQNKLLLRSLLNSFLKKVSEVILDSF
jgi:hypothetical protein